MLKKSLSAAKRIRQRFVIKGTLNRKVGSGHPRASTTKLDHRLKMTVLKGIRKLLLSKAKIQNSKKNRFFRLTKSKRVKEMGFLSKICGKKVFCVNISFPLKQLF